MNHRSLVFVRSRFPSMDEFVDEHGPIQQNNTSFEPGSWMFQPLVVQDPFVFTYVSLRLVTFPSDSFDSRTTIVSEPRCLNSLDSGRGVWATS